MHKTPIAAAFAALGLLASSAFAASATCEAQATEKKLAGAAKTSFLKKCESEAATAAATAASPACEKSAAEKKLYGAAKTSHIKKCMADEAAAAAKK